MATFLELNYSGVPETNCIKSFDYFEPSSPFDLSCSKSTDLFNGTNSKANSEKLISLHNEASTGKCVYVDMPELGTPFSI